MTPDATLHRLTDLVRSTSDRLTGWALTAESDFYSQGLDSLDHVNILMAVESEYGVRISDEDYDRLNSIAAIAAFLAGRGP